MIAKIKAYFSHEDSMPDHQSYHSAADFIGSNDDLLTEIILCLPVVSIFRFKSVSRKWRSLLSNASFTRRYDTRHFRHKSPLGLFTKENIYVPFDDEDLTDPPFRNLDLSLFPRSFMLLQSCNGLLLLYSTPGFNKYYVFNPTTNQLVMIPSVPGGGKAGWGTIYFMGLAFHQTDCPHYKAICILQLKRTLNRNDKLFQIQTYSSDTREWKISVSSFYASPPVFGSGVYWNGPVYWALYNRSYMYFKFDVEELHSLPLPVEAMSSKTLTRYLGESRDHLHLIVYDENEKNLLPLNVYEMAMDRSGWFLKYHVELDQLKELRGAFPRSVKPLTVIDVIRGEKDEDTFMVLMIRGLFITYNVHDKSFKPISKLNNIYEEMEFTPLFDTIHRYSQTLASL